MTIIIAGELITLWKLKLGLGCLVCAICSEKIEGNWLLIARETINLNSEIDLFHLLIYNLDEFVTKDQCLCVHVNIPCGVRYAIYNNCYSCINSLHSQIHSITAIVKWHGTYWMVTLVNDRNLDGENVTFCRYISSSFEKLLSWIIWNHHTSE